MTENKVLVSIIVPIYNVGDFVGACIKSIINQTYKNLEIILVDDGSTDNSGKLCDGFKKTDDRIWVLHKDNGGLSDARNAGVAKATGDYFVFVDGDDFLDERMVEVLLGIILETGADIACCGFNHIQKDCPLPKERQDIVITVFSKTEAMNSVDQIGVVAWNKIYARNIFNHVSYPIGRQHEDEFVIHRILYEANKVAVTNEKLYNYVIRDGAITSKKTPKRLHDAIEAFDDRLEFIREKHWEDVEFIAEKQYTDYLWNELYNSEIYSQRDKRYLKRKLLIRIICAKKYKLNRMDRLIIFGRKFYQWALKEKSVLRLKMR